VGDAISLFAAVDGMMDFPAGQPFHVAHGYSFDETNPSDRVQQTSYFALDLDGEALVPDGILVPGDSGQVVWLFNFPDGLTGTHILTGHWWQECQFTDSQSCASPTEMVEVGSQTVSVNFTP
jgi:hypothetical protein